MTDRPILFSGPMVRALLDGRKTQTRRVLKPQPRDGTRYTGIHYASDEPDSWFFNTPHGGQKIRTTFDECDQLWVRETFARIPVTAYALPKTVDPNDPDMAAHYRADFDRSGNPGWKPAIHMPRWASRLTLTVTDVRVQRLQEISEEDAVAEGCPGRLGPTPDFPDEWDPSPVEEYRALWDSLNASRGFGWEANPWIVAVTFTVERRNIDQVAA